MHYQLFIPNWPINADEASESRKRGITDIWENSDKLPNQTGPDDHTGLLVAWLTPKNSQHCYKPEKQTWIPSHLKLGDVPAYYVGFWNAELPTESELRRHYTQEGVLAEFGESKWILPTPTTVDSQAVYNDDGVSMRWEPIRKFSWMCDEAKLVSDRLQQGTEFGSMSMTFEDNPFEQVEWLLKLLRVNYRLLPEVAAHLGLWRRKQHILRTYLATFGLVIKGA